MAISPVGSMNRSLRAVLLVVGFLLIVGIGGYLFAQRFKPQWFDREAVNEAELTTLDSAKLSVSVNNSTNGWPQWLGPTRDGRAPASPLRTDWNLTPPTVLWSLPCGGGHSSFAVVNGRVYTQDYTGGIERVLCLDATSGQQIWAHEYPVNYDGIDRNFANGPRATVSVVGNRIFSIGATGKLLAIDTPAAAGGTPVVAWGHDLLAEFDAKLPNWGFARSPFVDGSLVIVQPGGKNGMLAAFDRQTGELRWKGGNDPDGYSSPTIAVTGGVRQVIAIGGSKIVGVRLEDGAQLWGKPWATQFQGNIATPLVIDDYLFVSSSYSKGCALFRLQSDAGGVRAEQVYFRANRVMQNHHANCVYRDGYLYGYVGGDLKCVNLRKGEVVPDWEARDDANKQLAKGNLILADQYLIGLTQTGTLFLADADPKEFRFRGQVPGVLTGSKCWALPVLVDGRVYLRDDTKIVCLDVRPLQK